MKHLSLTLIILFLSINLSAQETGKMIGYKEITKSRVKTQLEFLASDFTEGREPGTPGIELAAQYISSMYAYAGLAPFNLFDKADIKSRPSYTQTFPIIKYSRQGESSLEIIENSGHLMLKKNLDYMWGRSYDISFNKQAKVVFAGYGIADDEKNYNDLKKLDIKNKVVVLLGDYPGDHDPDSDLALRFMPSRKDYRAYGKLIRAKYDNLIKEGAAGIIIISKDDGGLSYGAKNKNLRFRNKHMESDTPLDSYYKHSMKLVGDIDKQVPILYVSRRIGDYLLKESGMSAKQLRKKALQTGEPVKANINGEVKLSYKSDAQVINSSNVLGVIKGEIEDEYIVLGAHYDHLGKYNGQIFNGADDNASGTVAVMMLAKAFKESGVKPKRTMVFAAWTAEESGLLGSKYFVNNIDTSKVKFYLNFDMISRNGKTDSLKNKAHFIYTSGYPRLENTLENAIEENTIQLAMTYKNKKKPSGGSDFAPFAQRNIPIGYFFAGWHDQYHQPQDEINKVDFNKTTEIIKAAYFSLWDIVNGDELIKEE